jgi:hypothetical protein
MADTPLYYSDKKHVRDAWIWAATIIAFGVLCALFVQVPNKGAPDVQASSHLP